MATAGVKPTDLRDAIEELENRQQSEQYGTFCEEFMHGNWFYDALVENEVDLIQELRVILGERR